MCCAVNVNVVVSDKSDCTFYITSHLFAKRHEVWNGRQQRLCQHFAFNISRLLLKLALKKIYSYGSFTTALEQWEVSTEEV